MKIDKKIIKELSDYLDEFNLTELEYTEKDTKIKVSKNNVSISNLNPNNKNLNINSEPPQTNVKKSGVEVTSPIIGTAKTLTATIAKPIAAIMTRTSSTSGYELGLLAAAGSLTILPGAFVIYFVRNYIAKGFAMGRV